MTTTILTIQEAWNKRRNLCAESKKLSVEAYKLFAEVSYAFHAEDEKLRAESRKLYAEGNLVFYNAVIAHHGNAEIKWEGENCEVCGVKYFFQEPKAPCEGKIVEFDGVKYKLSKV